MNLKDALIQACHKNGTKVPYGLNLPYRSEAQRRQDNANRKALQVRA